MYLTLCTLIVIVVRNQRGNVTLCVRKCHYITNIVQIISSGNSSFSVSDPEVMNMNTGESLLLEAGEGGSRATCAHGKDVSESDSNRWDEDDDVRGT